MATEIRERGVVVSWRDRTWGFIRPFGASHAPEIFVHHCNVRWPPGKSRDLPHDQIVWFSRSTNPRTGQPQAVNVVFDDDPVISEHGGLT